MAPIGPLARILVQAAVMGASILARALPAAYGAALNNARKGGVDAAKASGESVFGKKRIAFDEALMVLNLQDAGEKVTAEQVQKQYDRFFQANSVENGGSFYLQSKIYRSKELLDEFIKEKREEEKMNS